MKQSMRNLAGLLKNVNKSQKVSKKLASKKNFQHKHNLSYGERKHQAFLEGKNA